MIPGLCRRGNVLQFKSSSLLAEEPAILYTGDWSTLQSRVNSCDGRRPGQEAKASTIEVHPLCAASGNFCL